eukprot:gnl/TRDRNA2_/TRDRNA2_163920_c1_seq1.p1 gnl/TRDRNA2_/TRDRNA2_163920_c1~~gnl/TRDRNA2_/TRDRNA2_163920_c1_seq1.p1  ORF type:complete len:253 (+),score=40.99 gnl/TRDRNA2_/TRDRNA2_163920_c1_seq1:55-813(+)
MGNAAGSSDADLPSAQDDDHSAGHVVRLAVTEILAVAGQTAYHSSVVVDDKEYFFDSLGIMCAPAFWSHLVGQARRPDDLRTDVYEVGRSSHSGRDMVEALSAYFDKGTYDILYKNCNAFTDCALYFLTKTRLDPRFTRIERFMIAANPVSTGLLNRLFRAYVENTTGKQCDIDIYATNPEAEDFCISDMIAQIDEIQEIDDDVSEVGIMCGGFSHLQPNCCDHRGMRAGTGVPQELSISQPGVIRLVTSSH